jgi:festuclavine dehydrogenase
MTITLSFFPCSENFVDNPRHENITKESALYSGTNIGRLPWISANDIAEAAFRALTDVQSHNTDHVLIGPELWSYDDVGSAMLLDSALFQ